MLWNSVKLNFNYYLLLPTIFVEQQFDMAILIPRWDFKSVFSNLHEFKKKYKSEKIEKKNYVVKKYA